MPQSAARRKSSSARGKKSAQQRSRFAGTDPCIYVRAMVAARAGENPGAMFNPAAFGIAGAVVEPPDACLRYGSGAHRAGFKRDPKVAVNQPLRAEQRAGLADRHNLGMRGGIIGLAHHIAGKAEHGFTLHDDRRDGHLASQRGIARAIKRLLHWKGKRKRHFLPLTRSGG